MIRLVFSWLFLWIALASMSAYAHEVHHTISAGSAVIVQLKYADGKPFAFEAFEATPDGAEIPAQVGRTDAQGRALFIPGETARWKLKAYTADGHGVSLKFDAPAIAATGSNPGSDTSDTPSRASLLLFGLSLLIGGFGLYQLRFKKDK
ncbi:MAG: type permease [Burkholderiaceae bacterium]|nr:type permease [Burkholderiaceae bacterium]